MSTRNVTPIRPDVDIAQPPQVEDVEPAWSVELPNFPDSYVVAFYDWDGRTNDWDRANATLRYGGWPRDLLAAGVITAELAVPTGKRKRPAPDGGPVSITRYWRLKNGRPHRYLQALLSRPIDQLRRWPMALEALAVFERYDAWRAARKRCLHPDTEQRKSTPRLAVDNTRGPDSAP